MNLSLNKQDLKQLDTQHYITIPYEDRELIVMDKRELEKAKKLDLLYLSFLEDKSKGQVFTINTDEELEKHLEDLEKCIS